MSKWMSQNYPPWADRERSYRGEQQLPHPVSKSLRNISIFGASMYGLHRLGQRSFGGRRPYDYFARGIRGLEEYTPVHMFRTFQLGNFFSQYTTAATQAQAFAPSSFIENRASRRYMTALLGGDASTAARLMSEGVTYRGGRLYWGAGEDVALKYASVVLNQPIGDIDRPMARWSAGYARSLGVQDYNPLWKGPKWEEHFGRVGAQVVGGKSRLQQAGRVAGAWGTEWVGRFNRLLVDPVEMPVFSQVFGAAQKGISRLTRGKISMPHGLGVRPAGGASMLLRLASKWGVAAGLGLVLWKEIDRLTRNSELAEGTLLEEGTNVALLSLWAKTNVLMSRAAEATGLHTYREKQEAIAPGSTRLSRLAGFPIAGALGGATAMYGLRVLRTARGQLAGLPMEEAGRLAKIAGQEFGEGAFGKLGKWLQKSRAFSKVSPLGAAALLGAAVGTALVAPFLPGALVPSDRPDKLERIYSGEEEVAIRKGRWWTAGRSKYEGSRILHFAPHLVARTRMRAKEKALWGEEADTRSEFSKLFAREFTYELENKNLPGYAAPISSLPFADVPLIGPLLSGTIGRFIKPPRLLRQDEWKAATPEGEEIYAPEGLRYGQEFQGKLGEVPRGAPESPYGLKQTLRKQAYLMTEMAGLPGFISTAIKEKLTGSQDLFSDVMELESFRRAHGNERSYWDEQMGDPIMANEWLRRLIPHRIRSVPQYNPLESGAPSWLPGPGEKSQDFQHGMLMAKVPMGELRLPGRGYEQRFPELEGVDPENYPTLHRYKILADVGLYTDKFKQEQRAVRQMRNTEEWDDRSERLYQATERQIRERKAREEFEEYQYLTPYGKAGAGNTTEQRVLARLNEASAAGLKPPTTIAKLFGGYWEWLTHNSELAIEQLTPVAPINKFVHMRDAIEDYRRTQLYSDEYAFWQTPIESFVKPFAHMAAKAFGSEGIPGKVQKRRELDQYFDVLKYMKYHRLALRAQEDGNQAGVKEYSKKRSETMFGLNPYTRSMGNIYRALPRRERNYFMRFAGARTPEERAQIIKMVPENEKALYTAQWQLSYAQRLADAQKQGLLSGDLSDDASRQADYLRDLRKNQGFQTSDGLFYEYLHNKVRGESYSDWYRRSKLLPGALNGKYIPGPDFTGFNPATDLDEVKLKVIENEGLNMHSFDMWDDQLRGLQHKPFITDDTAYQLRERQTYTEDEIRGRLDGLFHSEGMRGGYTVTRKHSTFGKNTVTIDLEHDQSKRAREMLMEGLNG